MRGRDINEMPLESGSNKAKIEAFKGNGMTENPLLDPNLLETPYALQKHLGFELTAWQDGFAIIEAPLAPILMNRQGIPHGGIHATLMDSAMGYAGCYTGDPNLQQMALTPVSYTHLTLPTSDLV